MRYEAPVVIDFGSVADHTFQAGQGQPGKGVKGGGVIQHLDVHCEWSSGQGEDKCN